MAYGPITLDFSRKLYLLFAVIAVACVWMARNLRHSDAGRAMLAVRDHQLAAGALGIDPARTKITAFALSSFLAAVAGAMFALQQQYLTIEPFNLSMSVDFVAMIVIGGVGTVFGAVAGAMAFVFLGPLLEELGGYLPLLSELPSSQQSTVLFAILVCAFLVFEPRGLVGVWERVREGRARAGSGRKNRV
jgi:branched-chain amino acid transport system permease protein